MKSKLLLWFVLFCVLLPGCDGSSDPIAPAMELRSRLVSSAGCSFDVWITADYGEALYTFEMQCQSDDAGNVAFTVTAPETIAGITGTVSQQGGKLTFDHTALAFELLADGGFSPVSAPWVLVHTLRSGYITSCAESENGTLVSIGDSYEDDALNLSVWLGLDGLPTGAEVFWQGRRVLSLSVKNFSFQ
jgi:hypothetical protein